MVLRQNKALFTRAPRVVSEIKVLSKTENLKPFIIERTIILSELGFYNLVADLTVERSYFIKYKSLCRIDDSGVWHCLLVVLRSHSEGLLFTVDESGIPYFAALFWKKYRFPNISE